MSDRILSPDGKFMWTGSEWIPAPPVSGNSIEMNDSVIGGDVISNTTINNDPKAVTDAVISALQHLGLISEPSAPLLPPAVTEQLPHSFNVGDHVEYYSPTNQRWINRCRVIAVNEDGTYEIDFPYADQSQITRTVVIGTSPGTIRPASMPFKVGDRVFVNWKNYGHYYAGKIVKQNEDFSFMIHFDDGDVEDGVEWNRIEPLNENSTEVQTYMQHDAEAEKDLIEAFQVFDTNNTGTISAKEYFRILTEIGDNPVPVEEVMAEFEEMGIRMDSELDYRSLAKYMLASEESGNKTQLKPQVIIKDAYLEDGTLKGYAYSHPKLGETNIRTSAIQNISYDERATALVETLNTVYVVGPTGWKIRPENHPFNNPYSVNQKVKVEWNGTWWDATILKIESGKFLITYEGFDSSWDEWIDNNRIRTD